MILFLHNRYRTPGGEEQAVDNLLWLVREHLGEDAELLQRDSAITGRLAAAAGLLGGGLRPDEVASAVRRTRARVVHAHNLNPSLGWRALAAARQAGARVVLHLHQYRLVCAVGVCFTAGAECTRCHGRNAAPGVLRNCRGSLPEAMLYGAAIALWQRKLVSHVDAFAVPSRFALARLQALGAPIPNAHVIPHVVREIATELHQTSNGPALLATRLAPEKGIDTAIEACRIAGIQLVVAGDGPERARLESRTPDTMFLGHVDQLGLARLRREAAVGLAPSRSAETFGLAAAEAMAAGLPVVGSHIGALPELVPVDWLVAPGDPLALANAIEKVRLDPAARTTAIRRVHEVASPEVVAPLLAGIYSHAAA